MTSGKMRSGYTAPPPPGFGAEGRGLPRRRPALPDCGDVEACSQGTQEGDASLERGGLGEWGPGETGACVGRVGMNLLEDARETADTLPWRLSVESSPNGPGRGSSLPVFVAARFLNFLLNDTCEGAVEMESFLHYSVAPSIIIIIILACLEERARRCYLDEKLLSLNGRVGVLIPFDFVSSFSNRWSLGFAFGVTADKVMFLFIQNYQPHGLPHWAKIFWILFIAMEVGISSYPFFACLSTSYVITGATLGFLYTAAWVTIMVTDIAQCPEGDFVAFEFLCVKIFILPMLRMMTVLEMSHLSSSLEEFVNVTQGVWILTTAVSSVTCISYVFHILVCYRKHMKSLRSGKKHYLLPKCSTVTSSQCVVAVGKYISWQVAYILWGYLIMHLVQWVFGMTLMYILILPMTRGQWQELLDKWGPVVLSFIIIMVIRKLQIIAAASFFLQPKISPDDKQKPLALDNRKAFMNFSYFLFFHSVVVGLMSCLMRLVRSIVLGAWLVGRIDTPVMPMGFESCDKGFSSWVQMLYLDHYHTNPILVCFCYLLESANRKRKQQRATVDVAIIELKETDFRVSHKARTRWLLLYTLLNNPTLQRIRKLKPGFSTDWPQHGFA
ncbi:stimulated by retinoic acid gene 6 protein-like [Elgaria multicarinata webbii]|uniref:stimulated by retinoic acid gene 6 protein-like n=1 Tax=Elgaria multicarinata webbii TaxID=159646 RepID=UPI002FCD415B